MKKIDANELYQNLSGFLLAHGVELKDGAYTERIRKGCHTLTEVINTTQNTVARARGTVDRNLDRLRQTIHDATAPEAPRTPGAPPPAASTPRSARPTRPAAKSPGKSPRTSRRK
jgi:hypothetical protein